MVPWQSCLNRDELHRLLRVQIDDAIEADRVFTMLMGDEGKLNASQPTPLCNPNTTLMGWLPWCDS
jgi:hypothetical protein